MEKDKKMTKIANDLTELIGNTPGSLKIQEIGASFVPGF